MATQVRQPPTWLKIGATIAAAGLFSYIAFKVLIGLTALIAAAVLSLFCLKLGPVLAEVLNNLKMKLLKSEWEKSPIPTLQNQAIRYHAVRDAKKTSLEIALGKIETIRTKFDNYARKYPKDVAENTKNARLMAAYDVKMNAAKRSFEQLCRDVVEFDKVVEQAEDKWDVAMAVRDFDMANDFNNDPMELIRRRTSLTAVENAVNLSLASLETSVLEINAVEPDAPDIIEINPIPAKLPEKVSVR